MLRATLGIVLLCVAPVAAGQDGGSSQQPPPPPGQLTLQAESQEQVEKGHVKAKGYVAIVSGDMLLQADTVDFWNEEMRLVAEGNVVFQQGDQKIVGDRVEVNLDDGTGKFYNAYGYAGSDLYFRGEVIERVSEDVYIIERGAFTACAQPTPRWRFTSGKAYVRRDHHVRLHSAFLKVKTVPVFYLPILYYPINERQRSTGFLLPQIGNSSFKGFLFNQGFFWAINRSMDATINADYFSQAGVGLGTDYRYVMSPTSRGNVDTYIFREKETTSREYTIRSSVNQDVPGGFRATARVDYFSSFEFQQRFQENLNRATRRSKRATVNVSRSWSLYTFRFLYDRNETAFGKRTALREILPQVSLGMRPTPIFGSPIVFSLDGQASSFTRDIRGALIDYQRFDVLPTISYPFTALPWLTFRSTYLTRYTYYTGQIKGSEFVEEPLGRRYQEIRFDMRGPTFFRIFNRPGGGYAERYKHLIEPQFVWSYRSRVDDFDNIVKFDSQDYVPGTNQLSFNLVNRFFAKRKVGARGLAVPVEFLTWTLSQRYFFNVNASLYDTQFTTPYFTEDGVPSSYSPVTSKLTFRPSGRLGATWNLEYDVSFNTIRSNSIAAFFAGKNWGSVAGSWSQRALLPSDAVRRAVRGVTTLNLTRKIQARFESSYDVELKNLQLLKAAVHYNVQCCGFMFEFSRYNFSEFREENLFRVGVTLANIGSFGTNLNSPGRVQ
jgi:LPS-assembly protein